MKKLITLLAIIASLIGSSSTGQTTMLQNIFMDHFLGTIVDSNKWKIPTWTGPTDGTFIGRTQFRCTPAALPSCSTSYVFINLETYNPTGFSFYGTDLISKRSFTQGDGLVFTVRAKLNTTVGGIVGGLFTYENVTLSTHDEIDCELVSNHLNYLHTNVYDEQPLGPGNFDSTWISIPIDQWHIYKVIWEPTQIQWLIDSVLIRTEYTYLPDGAMPYHLNNWAPDQGWAGAYNANLQPTNNQSLNQIYSVMVDFVRVDSIENITTGIAEVQSSQMKFSPNPTHDYIHFTTTDISVIIYNIDGAMVMNKEAINGNLQVSDLSPGVYMVKYGSKDVQKTEKLIIY